MRATKILFLATILVAFAGMSSAYVGTAPGVLDMGSLEPGNTYEGYFYILTDRGDPFLIEPGYTRPQTSILTDGPKNRYDFKPSRASDEDISSWIDMQDAYQVDPSTERVIELQNGGVARANQKIDFTVDVPRDAEPGYHAGAININPNFGGSAVGTTTVQTVGVTQFIFVFYVDRDTPPTQARRDLNMMDVNSLRVDENKVRLDFLMQNNGSVTTRIQRAETMIYNQVGNESGRVVTGGDYLGPGETRIVKTYWKKDSLEPGMYRVEGEMGYVTGQAYIDETINVSEMIEVESTPDGEDQEDVPYWMVIMLMVLLGSLMYYFELDPVWIILLLGVAGISFYIVTTGVPNYLVALLLLLSGLVLKYG